MKKLLFIGQLPPPYNGQNLQIQRIKGVLDRKGYNYKFIQLDFSSDNQSVGVVGFKKIVTLLKIFFKIVWLILTYRPNYVHYPPAGPNRAPMFRDFFLLFPIRLFNFRVIYRFHAGGISTMYPHLNSLIKAIYRFVYFYPAYGTCMSEAGKVDAEFLRAKKIKIIPNGVEDKGFDLALRPLIQQSFTVLFIGLCIPSKGIYHFLDVVEMAQKAVPHLKGKIIGEIIDKDVKDRINNEAKKGLVSYEGICTGQRKNDLINECHLLLFPTFYPSENFPTVVLEAFSFGLPVIASKWRGVVDQIVDGQNGKIHEVGAKEEMANSLIEIASDEKLYQRLSKNARESYLERYTISNFEQNFTEFFDVLALRSLKKKKVELLQPK